jgi:uncharacterized protein (DUF427 family)
MWLERDRELLRPRSGRPRNKTAAWYYPTPMGAAKDMVGFVAFWKGVKIE